MSACMQCGRDFDCGMVDPGAATPCWCTTLPALPAERLLGTRDTARCYCPHCLRQQLFATDQGASVPGR